MLFWRLTIGIPLVALLLFLCYLDDRISVPGAVLLPLFFVCVFFLCKELLDLLRCGGLNPRKSTVYIGVFSMMTLCWFSCYRSFPQVIEHGWDKAASGCVLTLLSMAVGVIIAFIGEMIRYRSPGRHTIDLAGAIFIITYIGMLGCFMIMLRIAYGIAAVLSLVIVTKLCDIGAFTVGKLFGRRKLVPSLSPGKTIEGMIGGLLFSILGSCLVFEVLFPCCFPAQFRSVTTPLGVLLFGLLVGVTGAVGDLAESLIKRDVGQKDSGKNVPGFGGFLDIFDSLLLAAPVTFGFWAFFYHDSGF